MTILIDGLPLRDAENWLVVARAKDQDHWQFRNFLESIPQGVKQLYSGFGFEGTLDEKLKDQVPEKHERLFMLLPKCSLETVNVEYFVMTPTAAILPQPNQLNARLEFETINKYRQVTGRFSTAVPLPVGEALEWYRKGQSASAQEIVESNLTKKLHEFLASDRMMDEHHAKLTPTLVSVALETVDGAYTIAFTLQRGPATQDVRAINSCRD